MGLTFRLPIPEPYVTAKSIYYTACVAYGSTLTSARRPINLDATQNNYMKKVAQTQLSKRD